MNNKKLHLGFALLSGVLTVTSIMSGSILFTALNGFFTYVNYQQYRRCL